MDMRVSLAAGLAAIAVLPLGVAMMNQTALSPIDQLWERADSSASVEAQPAAREADQVAETPAAAEAESLMESSDAAIAPAPMPAPAIAPAAPAMVQRQMSELPAVLAEPEQGDRFAGFEEGGVHTVRETPVSTFSIDVDTASYAYVRRMLEMGQVPPAEAIRVEELINYFDYDYPSPQDDAPFAPEISVTDSPWNPENRLVHIGVEGESVDLETAPPANLVLLIDTSGSMDAPDKLALLRRAFAMLVNEMGPEDTISIVTYAGNAGVVLEPTKGGEKAEILAALDNLVPGGSTAGAEGIEAAYRLAEQAMVEGGTNRVLLATDGDFNVGIADPEGLERLIEDKRDEGIFLSVLGFGTGNYDDQTMQTLAQAGNGNAAYIDSYTEARRVLVEQMGGTLVTIAKDVKIQVEFNPETVSEYRLIGYETRALAREDFNNDAVDAGDIGAGHTVTAIYEITPVGARGLVDPLRYGDEAAPSGEGSEYGWFKLRYKEPDAEASQLIEAPIPVGEVAMEGDIAFATAVAAFGQKLRGSDWLAAMDWDEIAALAQEGRGEDANGRRAEFIGLVGTAQSLLE
ncbi:VWA domain-containing protein [Pelagibacterium sp. H642]|uniref:vWA domain-containing protein n=1 Tax=Pelagibacterium sp. H642 TaxID=1881069 RepID=UPI00281680B4|nr:VWA domain-containing protein [Pelagibacterium sp. H642]